jgi:hypothetical protein
LCVCLLFVKTPAMQKQEAVGAGKGSGPPPPRHATGQAGRVTSHFTGIMQAAKQTNRSCEQLQGDRKKQLLYMTETELKKEGLTV